MTIRTALLALALLLSFINAWAGDYADTISVFKKAGASGGQHNATTIGDTYNKGMATFTVAKGDFGSGAVAERSLAPQVSPMLEARRFHKDGNRFSSGATIATGSRCLP